jgi:hypothetical protein
MSKRKATRRYGPEPRPIAERFWEKVDRRGDDECWLWLGTIDPNGYGRLGRGHNEASDLAHRVAWKVAHGAIPDGPGHHGICVLHRCDNPTCVNPSHLFLGTIADNVADMIAKGRANYNPLRGSANPNAKLTEAAVREIRQRYDQGERPQGLARAFGVTGPVISNIVARRAWRHVD